MTNVVGVLKLRQHMAEYIKRAEQGEAFVIVRNNEAVARLVPAREEPMSEDKASYTVGAPPDVDQLLREDLAGYLAFNAYHQAHSDKAEAIRALAEAILKVQALP